MTVGPLLPQQLYRVCDCQEFDFQTTDDLQPLEEIPGQGRALEAIRFGAEMPHPDYHLYLLGGHGTGRHRSAFALFEEQARERPTPQDWVYVHNFNTPHQPKAIALPPGRRPPPSQRRSRDFIEAPDPVDPRRLRAGGDIRGRIQAIDERYQKQQEKALRGAGQGSQGAGLRP